MMLRAVFVSVFLVFAVNAEDLDISLFSNYKYISVERFRGGLTAEDDIKVAMVEGIGLEENLFVFDGVSITNPIYKIRVYRQEEGDVPFDRWSNFYGFGLERDSVKVLEVYRQDNGQPVLKYDFELVGNIQLWEMYDGWLVRFEREGSVKHKTPLYSPKGCPLNRGYFSP